MLRKSNIKFQFSINDIPIIFLILGGVFLFIFAIYPWSYSFDTRILGIMGIMFITLGITLHIIAKHE